MAQTWSRAGSASSFAGSEWAQGVASVYAGCLSLFTGSSLSACQYALQGIFLLCYSDCRGFQAGRASSVTLLAACTMESVVCAGQCSGPVFRGSRWSALGHRKCTGHWGCASEQSLVDYGTLGNGASGHRMGNFCWGCTFEWSMHQLKGVSLGDGALAMECVSSLRNVPSYSWAVDFGGFWSPGTGATVLPLVVQFLQGNCPKALSPFQQGWFLSF